MQVITKLTEKTQKWSNAAYAWWVLMMIKICIPGNLAGYEFRLSQPPDKFNKILQKCLRCRSTSNQKTKNIILSGVYPMVLLCPLGWHNYPEVSNNQLISKEQFRYSKCRTVHNMKIITNILQGVPLLISLCPLDWHYYLVLPITQ